ncbi:MAG: hypothetical protein PVI57_00390 [Gemmatimonadota bacterium]|jgi:hypothetical protein
MKAYALLPVVLVLAACGGDPPPPPAAPPAPEPLGSLVPEERLYYDNSGGYPDSLRMVVRDQATFENVWSQATSRQPSPPPIPSIDFGESMVVLVAAGRMTPEDQIRVDSVAVREVLRADGNREEVLAVLVRVTEGCGRLQVDAYPVEIVQVPRFEGTVEFIERRDSSCGDGQPAARSRGRGDPPSTLRPGAWRPPR